MRKSMVTSERLRQPLVQSPYRRKLVQEVHRKLRKALDGPSQRGDVLHQLFTDIALEVDSRAQARLYGLAESSDSGTSFRPRDRNCAPCFYEVLAEHYAQMPEDAKEVLPLFFKLWSQSLAAQIFTLLFYEWLFEVPPEDSNGYLRYSTAFVEGASTIFWIDLQSNMQRFFSLYHYTLTEVVMNPQRHFRIQAQDRRQLVLMLSRFFFFYEPGAALGNFLVHFPIFPMNLGPADVFVIEVTDQLQKVKVEPVLLQYLNNARCLKGVELCVATSTRLKSALYAFTSPGGPMYPTRPVRHAAWETLDILFPVGRNSRHLISLLFRLIHPYYWPNSFLNFILISILGVQEKPARSIEGWIVLLVQCFVVYNVYQIQQQLHSRNESLHYLTSRSKTFQYQAYLECKCVGLEEAEVDSPLILEKAGQVEWFPPAYSLGIE